MTECAIAGSRRRMLALATTFSEPSIAQVGNTVVIAAQGASNSLDLYWQANGASGWNMETVAGIQTTYSAPSLAQDGNTTVIAAQGPAGSLDLYWAFNGTSAWNPELVAGAGTTISAPSLAINIGAVNIAAEGTARSLDYYWARNGSTTWNPGVAAAAGAIDSAPALSAHDGFANIVALNSIGAGSVFYWAENGSTVWTPSAMGSADTSASSIVAYPGSPGGVHIVAREWFGTLAEETDVNGSGTWQYTAVCTGNLQTTGCATSVPSVTMNDGSVNIADEDTYGNLYFYWQDSSGNFHRELVDTDADL